MSELTEYLARIGFSGTLRADLATLRELHRQHLQAIPFETLDAQLGLVPSMERDTVFEKLVRRRRGGWCYEMNGLFGWALGEMGFEVMRVACAVMFQHGGDAAMGKHLALLVRIDGEDWLADVGFGSSLAEPIPLRQATHAHPPFPVGLARTAEGYWRYSDYAAAEPFCFDFRAEPADEALLMEKCRWQATAPESNFVLNFAARRRLGDRHLALRGKVLSELGPDGETRRELADAEDFAVVLETLFGIEHPQARSIWPRIEARHAELFPQEAR